MKKVILFIFIIILTGCANSAPKEVENYLNKYRNLDKDVISDMTDIINDEQLDLENKNLYTMVFEKQYQDLIYKIKNQQYFKDEAIITATITVYDYYNAEKNSAEYLNSYPEEFNDESGNYDNDKYIEYKLTNMLNCSKTIEYDIDFYLIEVNNMWEISELADSDLKKIHGIYNYES